MSMFIHARKSVATLLVLALAATTACSEPNGNTAAKGASGSQSPGQEPPAVPPDGETGPAATLREATYCNIESVGGEAFGGELVAANGAEIRGWLGHGEPSEIKNPQLVAASEDGHVAVRLPVQRGEIRDDVVAAYTGREDLRQSGFSVDWQRSEAEPGRYHVFLEYEAGGSSFRCDNGRYILAN